MHLLLWCRRREEWASLAFALAALGVAGTAAGEMLMMRAPTPAEYGAVIRLTYVPIAVLVSALVGFVWASFGTGRAELARAALGLQGLALILNFTTGQNIVAREVLSLRQVRLFGEPVSVVAEAVGNPWICVDQLCAVFVLGFVGDAALRLWRQGGQEERRKALCVGGGLFAFILVAAGYSALVDLQVLHSPYCISLPFLGMVGVMGYEMSRDLLRASQLVRELRVSEAELQSSRAAIADELQFERLITEISTMLIHAPTADVEDSIVAAIGKVAQSLGFDVAAYSLLFGADEGVVAYVWNAPGVPGLPPDLTDKDFPWKARELHAGRDTHIRSVNDFPPEAHTDRATCERLGLKSSLDVSLLVGGRSVGVFSMGSFLQEQAVSKHVAQRQHILGDLFANAVVRARAEAALRDSERRLNLAANAAELGLWNWNIGKNTMWATDRAKTLFGLPPDGDVTYDMWAERLHPEDRPQVEAELREAVANRLVYALDYRILRADGQEHWIAAHGEPAYDPDGCPSSMSGVVMDITERRKAERELQGLRSDLSQAGRVTLLGQLASALAHELSQPLAAVLRNAEAAEMMLREPSPDLEELAALVADIREDDTRAAQVIDRMRSLLKRRHIELTAVRVDELVKDVVSLVRSDTSSTRVRIELDVAPGLPPVQGDRVHLQQVLLNLMVNALDATASDESGLRLIRVSAGLTDSGRVEMAVRDNGPGIPPELLGRLFEPFFTTKADGLGVGLAMSTTIVQAHHGRLWAENDPAGGAVFRFTVPLASSGGLA
jgi:PAS domain S-box-containing protein